jgi:hypothetical protein
MIISSDKLVQVYGADPDRWAKRHGLEPFSCKCHDCDRTKVTTIPVAAPDGIRGLMAPPCPCGSPAKTYCIVAVSCANLLSLERVPKRTRRNRSLASVTTLHEKGGQDVA